MSIVRRIGLQKINISCIRKCYSHSHSHNKETTIGDNPTKYSIIVRDRKGNEHNVPYKVGDNLLRCIQARQVSYFVILKVYIDIQKAILYIIIQNITPQVYLEGACEGSQACSTCHVILDPNFYTCIPEATEKEDDLLDQASCLTETSRLACQITLTEEHNGFVVELPKFSRNFYVDNHIPKPH